MKYIKNFCSNDFSKAIIKKYLGKPSSICPPSIKKKLDLTTDVSVIIPVYNEEKFITRLLDALNLQIYRGFEVIVVDNGSTDKTVKVIKNFKKKANYPLYLIQESTPGVDYARKKGMDEVLKRLVKREKNPFHILITTDADVISPKNWIKKIRKGFNASNIGGLAGTHEASEEVENKIKKSTGISNYFNIVPSLIEFLEKNRIGMIKMSGPNSAFTAVAYAAGNGIQREYDSCGKPKLNEVNNLGRRIRSFGYNINPMNCRVIKNRRRELFEILNNIEDSYFPNQNSLNGRFNIIREDEVTLLNKACATVPKKSWEIYRYRMVYKVIRNFIFNTLAAGEIKAKNISRLFTPEEIKIFSKDSLSFKNRQTINIFKKFLSRLEIKLYEPKRN